MERKLTTGYRVRPAAADDAAVITQHRTRMFDEAEGLDAATQRALIAAAEPVLAEMLATGEYIGLLACDDDGAVVAGLGAQIRRMIPRFNVLSGAEAVIVNVFVEPEHRRRGLARRLVVEMLAVLRTPAIGRITLHPTRVAREIYVALGFEETGELRYPRRLHAPDA